MIVDLYFSPEQGNVVFASAIDGWAFRVDAFAGMFANKLSKNAADLKKEMWGDWFFDSKTKKVVGIKERGSRPLKPMFVKFVLESIWAVYDAVYSTSGDKLERVEKIVEKLGLKVPPREIRTSKDPKSVIQTVMSAWMPLATAILLAVVDKLPSPLEAQKLRMPSIVGEELPVEIMNAVMACDKSEGAPVVGFISKIVSVPSIELPCNQRRKAQQSKEEMRIKREKYIEGLKMQKDNPEAVPSQAIDVKKEEEAVDESETLIGFARLYSGTIKRGDKVYVLGPKYDPKTPEEHSHEIVVERLYLLMGRELQELDFVPAGNVFGISGLDGSGIMKTATLSSSLTCPSLGALRMASKPILRVALEPADPSMVFETNG
jgi:ribosome assembly protein 1